MLRSCRHSPHPPTPSPQGLLSLPGHQGRVRQCGCRHPLSGPSLKVRLTLPCGLDEVLPRRPVLPSPLPGFTQGRLSGFRRHPARFPPFLPCCLLFMFLLCISPSPMVWFSRMLMILPLLLLLPCTAPTRVSSRLASAPSGQLPTPGKLTSPFPRPN